MDIRVWTPPADHPLKPFVLSVFRARFTGAPWTEVILPKGNVDLIFNLGAPVSASPPGALDAVSDHRYETAWVAGLKTAPFTTHPGPGSYLVGVSLYVESAAALLPFPPGVLLNRDVPEPEPLPEMETVRGRLAATDRFEEQCRVLMEWLRGRIAAPRGAGLVRRACALLRSAPPEHAVASTASRLGISTRHLRRLMTEHVGVGASEYVRLARFTRALPLLRRPDVAIARVALEAGYYDQPHFTREFRRFGGLTPQAYRAAPPHTTPGHVVTQVRSVQEERARADQDCAEKRKHTLTRPAES